MQAVIFADKINKKLLPLGEGIPTALLPVAGVSAAERMICLLARGGVKRGAVIAHECAERVVEAFGRFDGGQMELQLDIAGQRTGGGRAVKQRLLQESIIAVAGDLVCEVDVAAMLALFDATDSDCTVTVTEGGGYSLDGDGTLRRDAAGCAGIGEIYLLNSRCASLIPDSGVFELSDLIRELFDKGRTVTGVRCDYYRALASVSDYVDCQCDVMAGALGDEPKGERPSGDYKLFEPCVIGSNVHIGKGAVVGPNAVIGSDVIIGDNARVRRSVILKGAVLSESAHTDGAVVAQRAVVDSSAEMCEGSVLGAGAKLSSGTKLRENVRVWTGIETEPNTVYDSDVQAAQRSIEYFGNDGLAGENGAGLTPDFCCRVGAALGSIFEKVGVGCSDKNGSAAMAAATAAGVLGTGSQVWDYGRLIESQMAFVTAFCDLDVAAYVNVGPQCTIRLIGSGGLPISRSTEREIERRLSECDYKSARWNEYRKKVDVSGLRALYRQHIGALAPKGLAGTCARVRCADREAERLFEDTLSSLGCDVSRGMLMTLSASGARLTVSNPPDEPLSPERTVALCCLLELKRGHDLTVPADAPMSIDDMAARYGHSVRRYDCCPAAPSQPERRASVFGQLFLRDGIMAAVYILNFMKEQGVTLGELIKQLPQFSTAAQTICSPRVCDSLYGRTGGGSAVIGTDSGRIMLSPLAGRKGLRITAEAADAETAEELCSAAAEHLMSKLDKKLY